MQYTVPFYTDAYEGFAHTHGFLRLRKNGFLVEHQTKDAVFGMVKTAVKTSNLPFEEVVAIQYKSNWFRTIILLSTSSFTIAEAMGATGSFDAKLYIKRKHKKIAEDFVEQAQIMISEYQIQRLDSPNDSEQEMPRLGE